jgi:hypothetical protein
MLRPARNAERQLAEGRGPESLGRGKQVPGLLLPLALPLWLEIAAPAVLAYGFAPPPRKRPKTRRSRRKKATRPSAKPSAVVVPLRPSSSNPGRSRPGFCFFCDTRPIMGTTPPLTWPADKHPGIRRASRPRDQQEFSCPLYNIVFTELAKAAAEESPS